MLNESLTTLAPDGRPFQLTTLQNQAGMRVCLMDWGATWLSCELPLPEGEVREVLLGCASPEQYPQQSAYLGASIGRYANRVAKATFSREAETFHLVPNQNEHQLHGGRKAFMPAAGESSVRMQRRSLTNCTHRMAIRGIQGTSTHR